VKSNGNEPTNTCCSFGVDKNYHYFVVVVEIVVDQIEDYYWVD
jgi:hypothetical protein